MSCNPFSPQKQFLICFDSDGCVMDTMNCKHIECFGPCMVEEWSLQAWQKAILTRWNDINLFTMTRGVNRFLGLAQALTEIDAAYAKIAGLADLQAWVSQSKELSNAALQAEAERTGSACLQKALSWSKRVNEAIGALDDAQKLPYKGAAEGLAAAHARADVAIISSANREAVATEWEAHGLLRHVDVLKTQENGSKSACIRQLCEAGYDSAHVLMVGDAPGDLQAATGNGVLYYPILVRREEASWREFFETALDAFWGGNADYFAQKAHEFLDNLQG